jgi:DNA-binding response OmpR family regulator
LWTEFNERGKTVPVERASILIVDNDIDNCELLPAFLTQDGEQYDINTCNSFSEAQQLFTSRKFDLYITEYFIPDDQTVSEFCTSLRREYPEAPVIIYSVFGEKAAKEDALAAGANLYLVKPNDLDRICSSVRDLISRRYYHSVKPGPRLRATSIF